MAAWYINTWAGVVFCTTLCLFEHLRMDKFIEQSIITSICKVVKLFPLLSRHRSHHIQITSPNVIVVASNQFRDKSPDNGIFSIVKICAGFCRCRFTFQRTWLGHFFSESASDWSELYESHSYELVQYDPIGCQEHQIHFHDPSPLVQSELGTCIHKSSTCLSFPRFSQLCWPPPSHGRSKSGSPTHTT